MTAARATGSSTGADGAPGQLTGRPGRTPPWRCLHRPSRRTPHPTDPALELCHSCGATIRKGQQ